MIERDEIDKQIIFANSQFDEFTLNFWNLIEISPEKWKIEKSKFKAEYWVVGIFGKRCIYYNHFESGFNISNYSKYGIIDDYYCNDFSLETTIFHLIEYQLKKKMY